MMHPETPWSDYKKGARLTRHLHFVTVINFVNYNSTMIRLKHVPYDSYVAHIILVS